ncbi:GNAT family N-acetyltransferase [Phytoactinopolyspora endophytica]|uniref:GNAT family N-acetyltransferase n=1 Tax=Phytoactinopolyspora endophytica TaxID=1642495 RepID=UPI00197B25EF|nr:GNAT family N-acetyltransferase [Phytoactinopolyspora endophytica]
MVTDPALSYLSIVFGTDRSTVPDAIDLASAPIWNGVTPTLVAPFELDEDAEAQLLAAGLTRGRDRGLAFRRLDDHPSGRVAEERLHVVEVGAERADFLHVLLGGYETDGAISALIEAEHCLRAVRGFVAFEHGIPIAAAAMTFHDDVAVLGGASTLREHRGKGAQSCLLAHRLRLAVEADCTLAAATVVPDSVSAANLARAGFDVDRRSAWKNA